MAATFALKFCEMIWMCGWGLLVMNDDVGTLWAKYCIAFGILIGPKMEERPPTRRLAKTTMKRSDSSCTSLRITIDTRIGVACELDMDSK